MKFTVYDIITGEICTKKREKGWHVEIEVDRSSIVGPTGELNLIIMDTI